MKNIFLTIGKLDRGGAEMRILKLIKDLNFLNAEVQFIIYVISGKEGSLTKDFLENHNVNIIYGRPGISGLHLFYKTICSLDIDILHLNSSMAAGIYAFLGKLAKVPNIYAHIRTSEHYGSGFYYHLKQSFFAFLMNNFCNKVIGVCEGSQKLSKTSSSKWITIYNGVDLVNKIDPTYNKYSMICIGRQNPAKNHLFMVDVLAKLVDMYPDYPWKLDFYGREDEILKKELENRISMYGLKKYISLCGETKNPLETISNYHILVLPSIREGLPGTVLEALSVGVNSVVSNLPGCVEIKKYVECLEVVDDFSIENWVSSIKKICSENDNSRAIIKDYLKESPFTNIEHVNNIRKLWEV